MTILKVSTSGRNFPCVCGSGKKNKFCCKTNNQYESIKNSKSDFTEETENSSEKTEVTV